MSQFVGSFLCLLPPFLLVVYLARDHELCLQCGEDACKEGELLGYT